MLVQILGVIFFFYTFDHSSFFHMAYLNAWLTAFVGYTLLCSLLGWTTRGRHHTPVSVCLTGWPLHLDFSLLFCEKWSGFFNVHRVWLSYTWDWRLKVSYERLGNEDKAPCQRALLPRRDLNSCGTSSMEVRGHDSSSFLIVNNFVLYSWMTIKFWYSAEECTILWVWCGCIALFQFLLSCIL